MRHGAFAEGVELFDGGAFGIVAAEAEAMGPDQRQLLEVSLTAAVGAAWERAELTLSQTGCFVGEEPGVLRRLQRVEQGQLVHPDDRREERGLRLVRGAPPRQCEAQLAGDREANQRKLVYYYDWPYFGAGA